MKNDNQIVVCQDIVFFAFRYALGRKTYAVGEVVEELVRVWSQLDPRLQRQIKHEITEALILDRAGMKCDIESWNKVLKLEDDKEAEE